MSRTSRTRILLSCQQSLTTSTTCSPKLGLNFGWWKDRLPILQQQQDGYQNISGRVLTFEAFLRKLHQRRQGLTVCVAKICHNTTRSMKNVLALIQDLTTRLLLPNICWVLLRPWLRAAPHSLLASSLPEFSAANKTAPSRLMRSNELILSLIRCLPNTHK